MCIRDSDAVIAVGVNCSAPDDVLSAIETARAATEKPIVVYPNSGEGWDAQRRAWTGRSRVSVEQARSWRAAGAQVIGGCCRVRPEDIAAVADALTDPAA